MVEADTDKQFVFPMDGNDTLGNGTEYVSPWEADGVWVGTETQADELGSDLITMSAIYVVLTVKPGNFLEGKSRTFTLRQNAADTGLTVTIIQQTTGTNGTDVVISVDDLLDTKKTSAGRPAAASARITYLAELTQSSRTRRLSVD